MRTAFRPLHQRLRPDLRLRLAAAEGSEQGWQAIYAVSQPQTVDVHELLVLPMPTLED